MLPGVESCCMRALQRHGGELKIEIGWPWVDLARSYLLARFLRSKEELLLCVDSDVLFPPALVSTMIECDVSILTVAYRKRYAPFAWTAVPLAGKGGANWLEQLRNAPLHMRASGHRTIEIESNGLGLTLVKRDVVETMVAAFPSLRIFDDELGAFIPWLYQPFVRHDTSGLPRPCMDDHAFFHRAKGVGFRLECLLDAPIAHDGIAGNLGTVYDGTVPE